MTTYRHLTSLISPAFYDAHKAVKDNQIDELLTKGGRGSTKSSFISIELILLLLKHPQCHAAAMRKVGNTLRTSVYAQLCWAVSVLGLSNQFRCTVSPMEMTYLRTGQKILFFGIEDPQKLKSLKLPFGYMGIIWFEELDQFAGEEEIRNVEQTMLRGGEFSMVFKSFNPPATARSWANRYALERRERRMVHSSTYLTTPEEWLGPRFLADAEHLKETKPAAYAHEYLGEVVGSGTAVFENLRAEFITDAQVQSFDRRLFGVDWGWYPDPWAFNGCYYSAGTGTLTVFDELTRWRTPNPDTAQLLKDRRICSGEDDRLTADSAEEKSCGDYRAFGLPCRGAEKGPGSVSAGMKWLQSRPRIVIDPVRCPDTYREFSECEYERDKKTGEILQGYPDLNNHHIDAVRYATECIWKRRGR
ncbi:MAG: family phage terminase large subunit [Oscillospiraceae bacterium]|nr:family phage terminase large subunit [Oscillospiraceae bacterium]